MVKCFLNTVLDTTHTYEKYKFSINIIWIAMDVWLMIQINNIRTKTRWKIQKLVFLDSLVFNWCLS